MWSDILFDLDGTLTDSAPGILASVRHALADFGIKETDDEKLRGFLGPPLGESFRKFYGFDEAQADAAVRRYRERFATVGLFENAVYPGVEEMLRRLKTQGKRLYLATSKPLPYAQRILNRFALAPYFDGVNGVPLDRKEYSKADVIRSVLAGGNVAPGAAVMVGDRRYDVEGAKQNGLPCIGVLYGYGDAKELEKAGADHIVPSVQALRALLLRE